MGSPRTDSIVDLWAPVPFDDLPSKLREAAARGDWSSVREQLRQIMDGVTTDGVYGRALLQFVMQSPLPMDPTLERYRASICIDHGDWDGLRRHLAADPVAAAELVGIRDTILAPIDRREPAPATAPHQRVLFEIYEWSLQGAVRRYKRWAHRMLTFYPDAIWSRSDIPAGRHMRWRRLQDEAWIAVAESHGGTLSVAQASAQRAQSLGDEGEPLRDVAHDLERLVAYARGFPLRADLVMRQRLASPTGLSPLGAWETIYHLAPFLTYLDDGSLEWAAQVVHHVATRLGSPRIQIHANTWRAAAALRRGESADAAGLPALLAETRRAAPGLRVFPLLLRATATRDPSDFVAAERIARHVGNLFAQISMLTWLAALAPTRPRLRRFLSLLEITGWRRPVMVPPATIAEAATQLAHASFASAAVVELAQAGEVATATLDIAARYAEGADVPQPVRRAALDALGRLGTPRAQESLHRVARQPGPAGVHARQVLVGRMRPSLLTEREIEVIALAGEGLTNRQIAERLTLSQHTIARHLANARAKLGAANRAEAAVKLEELEATPR